MDTTVPRASSSTEDSDSDQSVRGKTSSDDDFTLVGKKRRQRKPRLEAPTTKSAKIEAKQVVEPRRSGNLAPSGIVSGPPKGPKLPTPPPLFLQDKEKWPTVSSWCNERRISYTNARATQHGIKVCVSTSNDHRELTKLLKEKQFSFHTYTLPEERLLRVVIRGLPKEISVTEIKASLITQGLPVHEVHRMVRGRSHEPFDMVLVVLDRNAQGKEVFKLSTVCHLSGIVVEPPRKRGTISQCHRCQLYGHSARNCFARPRCVKCLDDHATAECKRPKDRSLCKEPPACVLCGQVGHPANYRGCPKAPRAHKVRVASQRASPRLPTPQAPSPLSPQRPSPWNALAAPTAFPPLPSRPAPPLAKQQASRQPITASKVAQSTPQQPAKKVAQPTAKPCPAPVPVQSATPNTSQYEPDFLLVASFAQLADRATISQIATEIKSCLGNPMALLMVSVKYASVLDAYANFNATP